MLRYGRSLGGIAALAFACYAQAASIGKYKVVKSQPLCTREEWSTKDQLAAQQGNSLQILQGAQLANTTVLWPKQSQQAGEQGISTYTLHVSATGKVDKAELVSSSGFPHLDQLARAAMLGCRFQAGQVDGKPAPSAINATFTWTYNPSRFGIAMLSPQKVPGYPNSTAPQAMGAIYDETPPLTPEGVDYYLGEALQGNAGAQMELAYRSLLGNGTPKNVAAAAPWLRLLSAQENSDAQFILGMMLLYGQPDFSPDPVEGKQLLRKLVMKDHYGAIEQLPFYLLREGATPAELEEAVDWMRSLRTKSREATFHLAKCYEQGRGVAQDYAAAVEIYLDPITMYHYGPAQIALANLVERGLGVAKDPARAATLKAAGLVDIEHREKSHIQKGVCGTHCLELGGLDD